MQPYMDRVYSLWGYRFDRSVACKRYDVALRKGETEILIEEKYLFTDKRYDQMVVELIQDIPSGDFGWFYYSRPDWLVWVYCPSKTDEPRDFWVINFDAMRTTLLKRLRSSRSVISYIVNEHYGVTLNVPVKYADLEDAATHYRYSDFAESPAIT